jgi:hypothetical protein
LRIFNVKENIEMVGFVTVPVEFFKEDLVLPVIRELVGLGKAQGNPEDEEQKKKEIFYVMFHRDSPISE